MRRESYRLAAIVAWPALTWCVFEVGIRLATGEAASALEPAIMAASAAGMVSAAAIRQRQLAAVTPLPR